MKRFPSVLLVIIGLVGLNPAAAQAPASAPGDTEIARSIERYMQKAMANGFAGSVLAARGEAVILAKGYGFADRENKIAETADTVFSVGSITKQFTGAAILKLEMAGKLNVEDTLAKYIEGVPDDKKSITLHHLLTHTAGFIDALGDDYEPIGRDEFIKRAMGSKLQFPPGARYSYSNVGFSLLGIVVELVSGKNYEDYLAEALFRPAGMTRTGYLRPGFAKGDLAVGYRDGERWGTAMDRPWMSDGPGWHLRANGGILSTLGDMRRWVRALQTDTVLNEAARKEYFAPHVREYPEGNTYYGYGWVTEKNPRGTTLVWHNGGNGIYNAYAGFEPENGVVVIVSSNIAGKISDTYAERIRRIIFGEYKALDEGRLAGYTGTYRLATGAEIEVSFDENDMLTAVYKAAELVGPLAASGRENRAETERFDRKTKDMVSGALGGDFKALAAAWDEPFEQVQARASVYWGGKITRFGEVTAIEILGTVDRPRNFLTYARIDFARKTQFLTCVWDKDGGRLTDLRESDGLERQFEPRSDEEFVSPPIGASIVFRKEANGPMVMIIKKGEKELRAVKAGK
jgi:CubicO group peptidase (beta-lactamase class C family)